MFIEKKRTGKKLLKLKTVFNNFDDGTVLQKPPPLARYIQF